MGDQGTPKHASTAGEPTAPQTDQIQIFGIEAPVRGLLNFDFDENFDLEQKEENGLATSTATDAPINSIPKIPLHKLTEDEVTAVIEHQWGLASLAHALKGEQLTGLMLYRLKNEVVESMKSRNNKFSNIPASHWDIFWQEIKIARVNGVDNCFAIPLEEAQVEETDVLLETKPAFSVGANFMVNPAKQPALLCTWPKKITYKCPLTGDGWCGSCECFKGKKKKGKKKRAGAHCLFYCTESNRRFIKDYAEGTRKTRKDFSKFFKPREDKARAMFRDYFGGMLVRLRPNSLISVA